MPRSFLVGTEGTTGSKTTITSAESGPAGKDRGEPGSPRSGEKRAPEHPRVHRTDPAAAQNRDGSTQQTNGDARTFIHTHDLWFSEAHVDAKPLINTYIKFKWKREWNLQ